MIKITIKVSNDHSSLTEHFEANELTLSVNDKTLRSMIDKVVQAFEPAPVDTVIVKTSMEV
jgi:hypothetical protein